MASLPALRKNSAGYLFSIFLLFSILLGNFYLLEGLAAIDTIKIICFTVILVALFYIYNKYEKFSVHAKWIILLYFVYFVYLFVISLIYYFDEPLIIIRESVIYFLKVNMWLCVFFLILFNKYYDVKKIINLIIMMGILASVSTIINYLSTGLNLFSLPTFTLHLPRVDGGDPFVSAGIFGFYFPYRPVRLSYYFSEAAKLSQFLLGPFFLSIGLYKITRKRKFILLFLLFLATILITNTVMAHITLILMIPVVFFFNRGKFGQAFIVMLICVYMFFGFRAFSFFDEGKNTGSEYIDASINKGSTVMEKMIEYDVVREILKDDIFGVQGVFRTPYSRTYYIRENICETFFPSSWMKGPGGLSVGLFEDMARGGVVGFLFRGIILCTVVALFRKKYADRKAIIFKYSAFAYIALFAMSTSYGPNDIYQNLFYLALTIYLYNRRDDLILYGCEKE